MIRFACSFASLALVATAYATSPRVLATDLALDKVYLLQDLDNDGFCSTAGEITVFFDSTNLSGIPALGSIFSMIQTQNGDILVGDGDTDSIYRLRDSNHDGDAQDAGEAILLYVGGFGFPVQTPNGMAIGPGGDLFICTAGQSPVTFDAIVRCHDLDGDGIYIGEGEAPAWADLSTVPNSGPFAIIFSGPAAYFTDLRGSASDVIFRAQDNDNNGTVEVASELTIFNDTASGFGPAGFPVRSLGNTIYSVDTTASVNPQRLVAFTDLDNSGSINAAGEASVLWDESLLSALPGLTLGTVFDFDIKLINGRLEAFVGSSGAEAADNVYRLIDLTGDGDFNDAGETTRFAIGNAAAFPETLRTICVLKSCSADFNADGEVDFFDYLDFVDSFSSTAPSADFNQDSTIDFFDYLDFVDAFSVGC